MGESSKSKDLSFLKEFRSGPLEKYRKRTSFCWKEMAITIESQLSLEFKHKIWAMLENDPLFARTQKEMCFKDYRDVTMKRVLKILEYDFLPEEKMIVYPSLANALTVALQQYDGSVSTKRGILIDFFTNAIRGLGTSRHYEYLEAALTGKIFGCVAITEVGHGSNARGLRTTATYDASSQSFILNTPDFLAAKCWPGNLGKTATHACVTAKLYTKINKSENPLECHGLASFLVPIRDPKTMLPFPGVIIADLGPKLGLNGLDNGLMLFQNYCIPREALLNKTGDVTPEGTFISPKTFSNPSKRFGASLGNLSAARAGLIPMIAQLMCDALTIAIRYSCVRRQFSGNENATDEKELPVIEYQTQQYRLIPYLAAAYVIKYFGHSLFDEYVSFLFKTFSDPDKETVKLMGTDIHILSSSAKPLASWLARDAVQEARECCGGHGYLKLAGFGPLRNDNDANMTHEGENHVLLQQTSNWLLNIWTNTSNKMKPTQTPLRTLTFLEEMSTVSSCRFTATSVEDVIDPSNILKMYKWLVCRLLSSTHDKFNSIYRKTNNKIAAKNKSQIFYAKNLSIAYIEHYVLEHFWTQLLCSQTLSPNIRIVLTKVMCLYGLWSMEKHLSIFYQWGYMNKSNDAEIFRESLLYLCKDLRNEAVGLVDAIAPPDFILNSVLGVSDGEVYKHLQNALLQNSEAFQRDSNWPAISKRLTSLQSKL